MVRYIAENDEDSRTLYEAPPPAYLALLVEGRVSHSFPLRHEVQLGREKDNAIVVADHKVSRHHARLDPIDNTFIITDLGSANGTYVNGVLIAQPTRLKDRDRITVGDTVFLFTATPPDLNALEPASVPALPLSIQLPPSAAAASRGPVSFSADQTVPLWVLIGCMALIIVVLLFVLAMLLGVFVGRSQVTGLALLWLLWSF